MLIDENIFVVYGIYMVVIPEPIEFEWDKGNIDKNWLRHEVANTEIEEVFSDKEKVLGPDMQHSAAEPRHFLLGRTKNGRLLYVILTLRKGKVRAISARDVNKKQRRFYEEATKTA